MANEGGFEIVEPAGPETLVEGDPLVCLGEWSGLDPTAVRSTLNGTLEQSRTLQDLHMPCCSCERHGERLGKFADAAFAFCQTTQHGATRGIGQGAENAIKVGRRLFNHTDEYRPIPQSFNRLVEQSEASARQVCQHAFGNQSGRKGVFPV